MAKTKDELNQMAEKIRKVLTEDGVDFTDGLGVLQGVMIYYAIENKIHMADLLMSVAASTVLFQEQLEADQINELFQQASNKPNNDDDGSEGGPPEGTLLN